MHMFMKVNCRGPGTSNALVGVQGAGPLGSSLPLTARCWTSMQPYSTDPWSLSPCTCLQIQTPARSTHCHPTHSGQVLIQAAHAP